MDTRLTKNSWHDDNYLYLIYLEKFNQHKELNFNKLMYKFNRHAEIIQGAYVCNIDLMGGLEPIDTEAQTQSYESWSVLCHIDWDSTMKNPPQIVPMNKSGGILANITRWLPTAPHRSSWKQSLSMSWISPVIMMLYATVTLVLMIDIAYLYKYDINRLRLVRVQELIEEHGPQKKLIFNQNPLLDMSELTFSAMFNQFQRSRSSVITNNPKQKELISLGEFAQDLKMRIHETRHSLSFWGDKFLDWTMVSELIYLVFLFFAFIIFLVPHLNYLWVDRLDVQFIRDLVNYEDEERRVNARCKTEVLKYFVELYGLSDGRRHKGNDDEPSSPHATAHKHLEKFRHTDKLLKQMFNTGALRPYNRSSCWMERLNIIILNLNVWISFYCCLALIKPLSVLYEMHTPGYDLGGLCCLAIILINDIALTHFLIIIILYCMDQAMLVNRILGLVYDCIYLNQRQLWLYNHALAYESHGITLSTRARTEIIDKINSNYLFVLMTYKIFVAQHVSFRRTLRVYPLVALAGLFICPLLARIHVPYLGLNGVRSSHLRLLALYMCSTVVLPVNLVFLPMCYVNARCQELYKALSSLMAHITEVRSQSSGKKLYNEYVVRLLAKELSTPQLMLEKFVIRFFGIGCTFATIVKIHFWWGLVAISLLLDTQDDYKGISLLSFSGDPLGVWNFRIVQ